jgi:hypothetical protein
MYGIASTSGEFTARLNGAIQYPTATNTVGWTAAGSFTLGKTPDLLYFDGYVAEMILFDRVLSAGERSLVHTYLMDKYGI